MGLLARGVAMLNRALGDSEGRTVTYSRVVKGTTRSVVLTRARLGRTLFSGLQEQSVSVQWGERDYLIEAAELVLPTTGATTPQRGDRIADGAEVWELSSPQTEEPPWRWSDQERTTYRVHVKRVNA